MPSNNQHSSFMKRFMELSGLGPTAAYKYKDAFVQALRKEVMEAPVSVNPRDGQVLIDGLGTFYKGHIKERNYRNVQSGNVEIARAHHFLAFKAAKCNRKYESDQGVFEEVARLETDGSVSVAGIDYNRSGT